MSRVELVDLSQDFVRRVIAMGGRISILLKESSAHEVKECIQYAGLTSIMAIKLAVQVNIFLCSHKKCKSAKCKSAFLRIEKKSRHYCSDSSSDNIHETELLQTKVLGAGLCLQG